MTQEQIKEVLELHLKWLRNEEGGIRADLRHAYLRHADLSGADLRGAYLIDAYLRHADLRGADLRGADLRGADLSGAYLIDAYLRHAYLSGADLRHAYLRGADLSGAYLSGADLSGAYLSGADLSGATKVPMYCKWTHGITDGMVHIGCEKRTVEEWDEFFASDKIIQTERNTEEFKKIQAVYNAYKAYLLTFKSE